MKLSNGWKMMKGGNKKTLGEWETWDLHTCNCNPTWDTTMTQITSTKVSARRPVSDCTPTP